MFNAAFSRDLIVQREQELRALADAEHTVARARAVRRHAVRAERASARRAAAPGGCTKDPG
ncbi:MAG TPA: hypothetical protein VGM10_09650 [Actinocrinis sp.]|jgi:hypothetical protein